jgi:hypothetical protein
VAGVLRPDAHESSRCEHFYAQGISGIVLADPANDPHSLDGWNYVDDGYCCEGY